MHEEPTPPRTVEEKMDVIILHLERLDRRDRIRMWGGVVHSMLAIIPLLLFVWSSWYFYAHADELMEVLMQQAGQSAAASTEQGYENLMDQFRGYIGQ